MFARVSYIEKSPRREMWAFGHMCHNASMSTLSLKNGRVRFTPLYVARRLVRQPVRHSFNEGGSLGDGGTLIRFHLTLSLSSAAISTTAGDRLVEQASGLSQPASGRVASGKTFVPRPPGHLIASFRFRVIRGNSGQKNKLKYDPILSEV
jgi:hypothetical protein